MEEKFNNSQEERQFQQFQEYQKRQEEEKKKKRKKGWLFGCGGININYCWCNCVYWNFCE